ncbi:hypothetical protein FACS189442_5890 [Spirochaetia bacterium]|nr:hypothetical protein FACS189442_5890 [Spirochaetia bacterium]
MPQTPILTFKERCAILAQADEMKKVGKEDEALMFTMKNYPMPPYLAKFYKKHYGADFFIEGKYNLTEVEAEFGKDWLTR